MELENSETLWYRPKFGEFFGYIRHHQNDLLESLTFNSSSVYEDARRHNPISAFNYSSEFPAATASDNQRYIVFSPRNKYFFITHFEMQQRIDDSTSNFIKNWRFEGLTEQNEWILLDSGQSETSFQENGKTKLRSTKKGIYKSFRLSEHTDILLVVQKIEIYGFVCESIEECALSLLFRKTSKCFNTFSLLPLFLYLLI